MRARSIREGAELVILSVPAAQVVDPRAWDLEGPDRRSRLRRRHDLRLIQPHEAFEAAVRSESLYFGDVGHMTPRGHALLADELARFLTADRLIADRRPRQRVFHHVLQTDENR